MTTQARRNRLDVSRTIRQSRKMKLEIRPRFTSLIQIVAACSSAIALTPASGSSNEVKSESRVADLVISHGSQAKSSAGRRQQVSLSEDLLRQLSDGKAPPQRLRLNLFSGENPASVVGIVTEHRQRTPQTQVVRGTLENMPGQFTVIVHEGLLTLQVTSITGIYRVLPTKDGQYEAIEEGAPVSGSDVPLPPRPPDDTGAEKVELNAVEHGTEVDVLTIYTKTAGANRGGSTQVEAAIYINEAYVNDAFAAAQTAIRIVGIEEAPDDLPSGLAELTRSEYVKRRREEMMADLVIVVHHQFNNAPGVAYCFQPTYSASYNRDQIYVGLVNDDFILTYNTPAHEIGHLFGAGHEEKGSCMSSGYVWEATEPGSGTLMKFGTLMAYDGKRQPVLSNPDLAYEGVPVGTQNANNAAVVRQTSPTVANYLTRADAPRP